MSPVDNVDLGSNYMNEEQLELLTSIKKNSFNNKILNKRAVGGSCSFRETYVNNKKSLSTINSKNFPLLNHNQAVFPKLRQNQMPSISGVHEDSTGISYSL